MHMGVPTCRVVPFCCAGAGCVVGEQTEQLWAGLKRVLHLTRYMSAPNHQHTIEATLDAFSVHKQSDLVPIICRQHKNLVKRAGE